MADAEHNVAFTERSGHGLRRDVPSEVIYLQDCKQAGTGVRSGSPFSQMSGVWRDCYRDETSDVAFGMWTAGSEESVALKMEQHLFGVVLAGELSIEERGGHVTNFSARDAFVLPAGATIDWRQSASLEFSGSTCSPAGGIEEPAKLICLSRIAQLPAKPAMNPALLLDGAPTQHGLAVFSEPEKNWSVGLWDSSPYHRREIAFPHFELMHFREGSATITAFDGRSFEVVDNRPFLVPQGLCSDWRMTVPVSKFYCTYKQSD